MSVSKVMDLILRGRFAAPQDEGGGLLKQAFSLARPKRRSSSAEFRNRRRPPRRLPRWPTIARPRPQAISPIAPNVAIAAVEILEAGAAVASDIKPAGRFRLSPKSANPALGAGCARMSDGSASNAAKSVPSRQKGQPSVDPRASGAKGRTPARSATGDGDRDRCSLRPLCNESGGAGPVDIGRADRGRRGDRERRSSTKAFHLALLIEARPARCRRKERRDAGLSTRELSGARV